MHAASLSAPVAPSLHRFDAYRLALEFRAHVIRFLPLRRAELSDQLDRASISICLNIAEGAGRTTPRERGRHYTIARGSAFECLAVIDLLTIERSPSGLLGSAAPERPALRDPHGSHPPVGL